MAVAPVSRIRPTPDAREAAAIAGALEAFRRSFATPAPPAEPVMGAWQSAALLEGVDHAPRPSAPWGS